MVKRVDKSKVFGYSRPAFMTSVQAKILALNLQKPTADDWSLFKAIDTISNSMSTLF